MADTLLPDKWVRKAIYDAFNGTVVSGFTVEVFDFSATAKTFPPHHILISTQFNSPTDSHCGRGWLHTAQVEVNTTYRLNAGTRELCDDIANVLLPLLDNLQLDGASGMSVSKVSISFPGDLRESDLKNVYFRKIISVELEVR